jgi:hypothetical protein
MARLLVIEPAASLHTLLRKGPAQEDNTVLEVAHSYTGLQAADVALPEGVTLDVRYRIVW